MKSKVLFIVTTLFALACSPMKAQLSNSSSSQISPNPAPQPMPSPTPTPSPTPGPPPGPQPAPVPTPTPFPFPNPSTTGNLGDWATAGANFQRTSSSPADISAVSGVAWYRPIEAFISGTTQIITSNGKIFVATARGLIVLDAENGGLVCRFDTELPVNTPTVSDGNVYLPGFDRKLYSLNANTCTLNWSFTGGNGFSGNPIVVNERVYIGNRDGKFYAINASTGAEAWSYVTGGPIMQSAAYYDGILYFASMDMHGYALNANSGTLRWKTPSRLPGEQYTTWWPVIYANYIIWAGASAYKYNASPGALDVGPEGVDFNAFFERPPASLTAGTIITSSNGSHGWPVGSQVMSTTESTGPHTLQGWSDSFPTRRVYAIVNMSDGGEAFNLPWLESGQNNQGQMHPPVTDGQALYFNGPYLRQAGNIPRSRVVAWKQDTTWLRLPGNRTFAADEPLIVSMSGGRILANLCCDREAVTIEPNMPVFWSYGGNMLHNILPSQGEANSYDSMWAFYDGANFLQRLGGYYKGNTNSRNGVYNSHGMQNPLVPLAWMNSNNQRVVRLFTHRSNAIIALGPVSTQVPLALVTINPIPANPADTLSRTEVQERLEREVRTMVDLFTNRGSAGFLRPAYISDGGGVSNSNVSIESHNYFNVPSDTVYTLATAYPHLSATLKPQVLSYLSAYWQKYFVTNQVTSIGFNSGTQREAMVLPPEVATRMSQLPDVTTGSARQRLFLAAAKYAALVPAQAASIYNTVQPLLVYPPPATLDVVRGPALYNEYIIGYQGFLALYDLAGTNPDPTLRSNIELQLLSLIGTRTNNFAKDHPWQGEIDNPTGIMINNYSRKFNCSRNFMYLTPELGLIMRNSAQAPQISEAINEYLYVCQHWFMSRDHNAFQEASAHHIFDSHALFLAKSFILNQPSAELSKWIDVPWMLGDLYHIQNLVSVLEAD